MPFAQLKYNSAYVDAPNYSPVFKPADDIEIAFYLGVENEQYGEGSVYFDDILAVSLDSE